MQHAFAIFPRTTKKPNLTVLTQAEPTYQLELKPSDYK